MAKIKIKEVQQEYESYTLNEVKERFDHFETVLSNIKSIITETAIKISNFDYDKKHISNMIHMLDEMKSWKDDLKWHTEMVEIIKPILEKKQIEESRKVEIQSYINDNKISIQPLLEVVEQMKVKALEDYPNMDKEYNEMIHDYLVIQTVNLIKSKCGNLKECKHIHYNSNKGFDGLFIGENGFANIETIIAGGWNIQKLHYRTLVK